MTVIVLVRHCRPHAAAEGRFCGALDGGLSPRGCAEAAELAAALEAAQLGALYTSPFPRALETAAAVGGRAGLRPVVDDRLREIDFGEVEGLRYDELEAARPELFEAWLQAPTELAFPGGEAYRELQQRALAALDEIADRHADGTVCVVTHAGPIRAALAAWLSLPPEAVFRLDQRYGAVNVVDLTEGTITVRLLNGPPGSQVVDN
jgi:broad specificity phosphatase PhoE